MKEYSTADIRNLAVVGHGSSGKTMLCEAMLACAGVIGRLGSVERGSTVSDYHEEEQRRQISISASLMHIEWLGKKLNVIDTPGYLDFISDALGPLRVADSALLVVHASHGIEVGTEQVWEYATRFEVPKILVANGFDHEHTNFDSLLEQLRERFGNTVFPMTLPINPGPGFNQVLDTLRKKIVTYTGDDGGTYEESEPTGEWEERATDLHQELIEYVAESDDSLLERFFDEGNLTEEEMRDGLHEAASRGIFLPLFSTASVSNVGVARLLDFVAKFGTSPADRASVLGRADDDSETEVALSGPDPVLFVFKTISEAHVGDLSFFRLYSSSLKAGLELRNTANGASERIGQLFTMMGRDRTAARVLHGGDIAAVVKLRNTHTGDTLCASDNLVTLPPVDYPKPNIHGALKLQSKGDEDKIAAGLSTLHEEDPTFIYRVDPELHQTVISGQGELHLQVITDSLKNRFNVSIGLVEPKIPFRETIKARAESKYRHKKQTGGAGQFAEVWMRIEPMSRDTGVEFTNSLVGQNVDRVFVPSVAKGVSEACREGILAGYRVVDLKVDFYDGKMHPVDSKDVAFQIAGKQAFREAFLNARPLLLEPIFDIEVKVPEENLGDVIGDISGRRGRIVGMDTIGRFQIIKAQVPQLEMYRYSTVLRSLTGGRGIHSEEFSHYEELQRDLAEKVIAASKQQD